MYFYWLCLRLSQGLSHIHVSQEDFFKCAVALRVWEYWIFINLFEKGKSICRARLGSLINLTTSLAWMTTWDLLRPDASAALNIFFEINKCTLSSLWYVNPSKHFSEPLMMDERFWIICVSNLHWWSNGDVLSLHRTLALDF